MFCIALQFDSGLVHWFTHTKQEHHDREASRGRASSLRRATPKSNDVRRKILDEHALQCDELNNHNSQFLLSQVLSISTNLDPAQCHMHIATLVTSGLHSGSLPYCF